MDSSVQVLEYSYHIMSVLYNNKVIYYNQVKISCREKKKRIYSDAAEAWRASFTPLVVSDDGVLGREAECFIQILAAKIAERWKNTYSKVAGWIRAICHFEGHQSMSS